MRSSMSSPKLPVPAPAPAPDSDTSGALARSWVRRHPFAFGGAVLVAAVAGLWWRQRRRSRVVLTPMSERWLMQHEYDAGQQGGEV